MTEMDEVIQDALLRFEEACTSSMHQFCGGSRTCEKGIAKLGAWRSDQARAHLFDARRGVFERNDHLPQHDWSTSALLVYAREQLESQPNIRSLRRATGITMALARLGERGIPADCTVRKCIGPKLLRRIITVTANVWCDVAEGRMHREMVPELEAWLQAIDEEVAKSDWDASDRGKVILRSLQGVPRVRAEKWLAQAAVAHVLAWRLDDYTKTRVHAEDLSIGGDESASKWVFDRFTSTYLDEWSESSLDWEAAFKTYPDRIAGVIGVPLLVLQERVVTDEQIAQARIRSLLSDDAVITIDGIPAVEIVELAITQLESGRVDGALSMSEDALRKAPRSALLQLLVAFCQLPSDPVLSREVWQKEIARCDAGGKAVVDVDILKIDLAASHLMEGRGEEARRVLRSVQAETDEVAAWLWDPASLPDSPAVGYFSIEDWLARFKDAIN